MNVLNLFYDINHLDILLNILQMDTTITLQRLHTSLHLCTFGINHFKYMIFVYASSEKLIQRFRFRFYIGLRRN